MVMRVNRRRAMLPRVGITFLLVTVVYVLQSLPQDEHQQSFVGRRLLQTIVQDEVITETPDNNTVQDGGDALFPEDLFTMKQRRHGAVILHILGIMYMFYALALVCDEFFVPSLDVITDKLGISPDVAGATFMAAGGSAPELFTSVIGVFIAKSDVGIGTIVGSAVFNILFVIAACAFAAKEALSLTAWPLIRDVFFYSVALLLLVKFFDDNQIFWWEALILFIWYFAYVGFMKFNEPAEDCIRKLFRLPASNREGIERGVTLRNAHYRKGLYHLMNETINPGILTIMIGQHQTAAGISGLKTTLQPKEGETAPTTTTTSAISAPAAENGIDKEMEDMAAPPPKYEDIVKAKEEQQAPQHNNPAALGGGEGGDEAKTDEDGKKNEDGEGEEEEEPIDMSFPKNESWQKILLYCISFPIMAPLYFTLPDTKNKSKKKYFVITFTGSILWIAVYSYLMVWWATVAGDTIGIPPPVMGLTFLAAGTSVPDLITSVLVAKQGKGDMAVSSSVGSNIFDVTVGLPLPWLLWSAANSGQSVQVASTGVGCSVSMLFLMLLLVFLSILTFRWKMTKGMGIIMLVFYFIFVIVSLGFEYEFYSCPI